jgi:hypothetical protein
MFFLTHKCLSENSKLFITLLVLVIVDWGSQGFGHEWLLVAGYWLVSRCSHCWFRWWAVVVASHCGSMLVSWPSGYCIGLVLGWSWWAPE